MSNPSDKPDPRRAARQHAAMLRDVLRGKVTVHPVQQIPEQEQHEANPGVKPKPNTQSNAAPVASRRQHTSSGGKRQSAFPSNSSSHSNRHLLIIGERLRRSGKSRVAQLMKKTEQLSRVNYVLHTCLQAPLNDHTILAAIKPDGWVVQTDSSVWAYRLRYALPKARRQLREKLAVEVPPLRVRISPSAVAPSPLPPRRRFIVSRQTINLLESTAESFSDPRLGAALKRLAQHARQRTGKD